MDFEPICSPDANPECIWISFPDCASLHPGYELPKAAEVQTRIKGQLQAKAASQTPVGTDFHFLLSEEATFKFT